VNSSLGWDPSSKKKELFGKGSRFLLVTPPDSCGNISNDIVAFAMFRFDKEDKQDVIYWFAKRFPLVRGIIDRDAQAMNCRSRERLDAKVSEDG
jgi:hypothetical protein